MADDHAALGEPISPIVEESAEELYENAPCGYVSTTPDGVILRLNATLLAWLGYERDEVMGHKRFQELLTIGGRIYYETHFAPLLRMQGFLNEVQVDIARKYGGSLPVLLSSVVKLAPDGTPRVYRTTVFNIEDRKRYERELVLARRRAEAAAQSKADFLSMMSHEIRTPMSAITGIASLLRRTELSATQHRYVDILQSSSNNLLALLNDILDFSKLEAGKAALDVRPFDLRRLVYETLYGLNAKAEEKGIALKATIDPHVPPWLLGDPIKLRQVLANLASNAVKFTSEGSVEIAVDARAGDDAAVTLDFRVSDTGIGIPADRLESIFEEFSQAHAEISVRYGGTGLGLPIANKLLALKGSKLSVESEVDVGSTFSFTLRLDVAAAPAEGARAEEEAPRALVGKRGLIVDDSEVNIIMLSLYLRAWDVEVDVARDGQESLSLLEERDYDFVLMDLHMPAMNGQEAVRRIRALSDEQRRSVPVVAVTASAREEAIERHEGVAGFDDYLEKPIQVEQLLATLTRLTRAQRARAARG